MENTYWQSVISKKIQMCFKKKPHLRKSENPLKI